jgi:hypothetical protein
MFNFLRQRAIDMWPSDPTNFVAASGGRVRWFSFFVLVFLVSFISYGIIKLLGSIFRTQRNEAEFDPIYGVAGGSLDLREYRDSEAGEFTHEVVDRRGADSGGGRRRYPTQALSGPDRRRPAGGGPGLLGRLSSR